MRLTHRFPKKYFMPLILHFLVSSLWAFPVKKDSVSEILDTLKSLSFEQLLDVVVTASRKEELRDEAPNVMYTITEQQIRQRGYKTLRDVIMTIPGFSSFHRDLQYVTQIRGIAPNENEKISFLVNGISIDGLTETEILNGPINLQDIQRIEIIVGPGSVLYGARTLAGIVNMVTKKSNGSEIYTATNFQDFGTVTAITGQSWDEQRSIMGSFTWMEKGGFNGTWQNVELMGKVRPSFSAFACGEFDGWTIQMSTLKSVRPEGLSQPPGKQDNRHDEIDVLTFGKETALTDEITLTPKIIIDNKRMLRKNDRMGQNSGLGNTWDLHRIRYGTDIISQMDLGLHFLQFGFQGDFSLHHHNYWFNWSPDHPEYDPSETWIKQIVDHTHTYSVGGFASWEYQIIEQLKTVLAARVDYNTIIDTFDLLLNVSPRVAIIGKPFSRWTSKLMFNTATRMPSPWMSPLNSLWGDALVLGDLDNDGVADDILYQAPNWASANPMAEIPERLYSWEIQNVFYPLTTLRISLNTYYQVLRNFITWSEPFTNVGDFEGYGFEGDAKYMLLDDFCIWLNGAYQDAMFYKDKDLASIITADNPEDEVISVPKITGNAGMDISFLENFFFTPQVRYFTKQPAFDSHQYALDDSPLDESPYWKYIENQFYVDAGIGAELTFDDFLFRMISVSGTVRNITNNRHIVSAQFRKEVYQPRGRSWDVALRCRF